MSSTGSEHRFTLLAETIQEGVFIKDADRRYVYVNPALERLIGIPEPDIIGKTAVEVFGPDQGEKIETLECLVYEGGNSEGQFTVTVNGQDCLLQVSFSVLDRLDGQISSIMGTVSRSDEPAPSEDSLGLDRELYGRLFEGMPTGFALHEMIFDDDGKPIDYEYISVNPAFERLTGLKASTVIGNRITDVLPGIETHWIESFGAVVQTGEKHQFSNYSSDLDRHYDVTAYRPFPGHFACIFVDITERKKVEDVLRSSSELNDRVILESPIGMCVYDAESGVCIAANDVAGSVVGTTREQLLKQNFREIESWKRCGLLDKAEEALANETKTHLEMDVTSTFGKRVSLDCHLAPFEADDTRMLLLTMADISDRMQVHGIVQQERDLGLALSQMNSMDEMLSLCLDVAISIARMDSGGIYLSDTVTGDINLVAHRGLSPAFIEHVSCYPKGSPKAEVVMAGQPVYASFEDLFKDDPELKGTEDLGPIYILPICHNNEAVGCLNVTSHADDEVPEIARTMLESLVTQIGGAIVRLQTENALQESESRFRSYIESAPDGILVVDDEYRPLEINKAVTLATGYLFEDLMGKSFLSLVPDYEQNQALTAFKTLKMQDFMTTELPLRRKTGDVATFDISAVALSESRYLLFTKDITDRITMEGELRQAEKMQAIGQLAGGIAHDFNNQLAGMMGYAELLRNEIRDNPLLLGYTDEIISSAERAANLTSQLLAFSRKGKFMNVQVNTHKTIQEVTHLLEHSLDKKIRIEQDLQADNPITLGDPTQLHNALLNLAINASDAMPQGGTLSFSTRSMTLSEHFCRSLSYSIRAGNYIQVVISDTGSGIDESIIGRVFEPFFTTKAPGKGTGMGLAAVYGAIKNHGGSILLESEPNEGTKATIYLPQVDNSAVEEPTVEIESDTTRGTARILLIDDDPGVQSVGEELLKGMGYSVTVCADGREGVDYFRDHWNDVDLILLDMNMPVMSGEETFAAMRDIDPNVVVLVLSGYYSLDEKAQRMIDTGAKGFIQKPFRMATLSKSIEDALNRQA